MDDGAFVPWSRMSSERPDAIDDRSSDRTRLVSGTRPTHFDLCTVSIVERAHVTLSNLIRHRDGYALAEVHLKDLVLQCALAIVSF
jgi:hypothetical protein